MQIGYDDLGNVLTTGAAQPDKADYLRDSTGNDFIDSGGGADVIDAFRGGDDTINAGAGQDRVAGGAGADTINGGADQDVLAGGSGNDTIDGGMHDDRIDGEAEGDLIRGGDGSDFIGGGGGSDSIYGGSGNDTIWTAARTWSGSTDPAAAAASGLVEFSRGADWVLHAGRDAQGRLNTTIAPHGFDQPETALDGAADLAFGESGDDSIYGGGGGDYLDGGADNDSLVGGGGSDVLVGGEGGDYLVGDLLYLGALPGDDILDGGAGNDVAGGGEGSDVLLGGAGSDRLFGDGYIRVADSRVHGDDYVEGGDGNDLVQGGGGSDLLYGDAGDDTLLGDAVLMDDASFNVAYDVRNEGDDLLDGGAGRDTVVGGGGRDSLFGGTEDDVLYGDFGNAALHLERQTDDYLEGGAGNDTLYGEGGNDTLVGGAGDDTLNGGDGDDVYRYNLGDGSDTIVDAEGDNEVIFGAGVRATALNVRVVVQGPGENSIEIGLTNGQSLRITGGLSGAVGGVAFGDGTRWTAGELLLRSSNAADYQGTSADDRIIGTGHDDTLDGHEGSDVLIGQTGSDVLLGKSGNDTLDGGAGDDVLDGGIGRDVLIGGTGADTYRLGLGSGLDEIRDDGGLLQLGGDVRLSDLRIVRAGTDIELVWSSTDRALMRGAALNPVGWTVRLADGTTVALDELPAVPTGVGVADYSQARAEYLRDARRQWLAAQLARGLVLAEDGSLRGTLIASNGLGGTDTQYVSGTFAVDSRLVNDTTATARQRTTSVTATELSRSVSERTVYEPVTVSVPITMTIPAQPRGGYEGAPSTSNERTIIVGYRRSVQYVPRTAQITDRVLDVKERIVVDSLTTGAANNTITVYGGAIVDAGEGDDVIVPGWRSFFTPTDQPALLYGNAGHDRITGTVSDDWIIGGAGDDVLDGNFGSDRYYRFAGDGRDLIVDRGDPMPTVRDSDLGVSDATEEQILARLNADPAAIDTLVLPPGVASSDLTFSWTTRVLRVSVEDVELRSLDNYYGDWQFVAPIGTPLRPFDVELPVLVVQWGDGEQVELAMPTPQMPKGFGVEQIEFADGTILSRSDLLALAPPMDLNTIDRVNALTNVTRGYGGDGNDRLEGTNSDDELLGGRGNDVLLGGLGNDQLLGGKGADVLDGGGGNDWLGYSFGGGADEFYSDGNTYIGGTGNDVIFGTRDGDAYVFNLGDGRDTVRHDAPRFRPEPFADIDYLIEAGPGYVDYVLDETPEDVRAVARSDNSAIPVPLKELDTLKFGAGIGPADIQVSRQGDSLVFAHVNGTDAVSFERWFSSFASVTPSSVLERVEFADGTVWRVHADGSVEVVSVPGTLEGTDGDDALYAPGGGPSVMNGLGGNDLLVGAEGDDVIDGGTGNDTLYGNTGSDTLVGGEGDDTLQGGAGVDHLFGDHGNDVLVGGSEGDTLIGAAGDDVLAGGTGDDAIAPGAGTDTIIFNLGDGRDTVQPALVAGGGGEAGDSLALGAIAGGDIRLAREGNDLVLKVAQTEDAIRFSEWYTSPQNQTVGTLVLSASPLDAENVSYTGSLAADFRRIADAFDAAYANDPAIGDW
ncbi:MAG: calcium-binding protein, partial [Hyphomicrobiaceae bacterium]